MYFFQNGGEISTEFKKNSRILMTFNQIDSGNFESTVALRLAPSFFCILEFTKRLTLIYLDECL